MTDGFGARTQRAFEGPAWTASPTTSNRSYIEPGKIAGCQVAVARHGHLAYFKSLGRMDLERGRPMADDAIFRIYSMTKPITSVALMTLYEQGYFQLNDPVSRYFPSGRTRRSGSPATATRWS